MNIAFKEALQDNSIWNRLTNSSIGPSSIRMNTVIPLLQKYICDLPKNEDGQPIENTGYDLLKYEDDYYRLTLDIIFNEDVHFIFTGMILKEAELFYSDKNTREKIIDFYYAPEEAMIRKSAFPDTDLAWQLLDRDTQIGIMITYFNADHLALTQTANNYYHELSGLPVTTFYGAIENLGKSYSFPQYFSNPGAGDTGGQMYVMIKPLY